jgi:hypothetical protein
MIHDMVAADTEDSRSCHYNLISSQQDGRRFKIDDGWI